MNISLGRRVARRWGRTATVSAVLFVTAFAVKTLHVEERQQLPDFARPTMDSKIHDDWAWGLASGEWEPRIAVTQTEPFFRAPLYPYFLSGVYRLFGRDYYAARLIQAFIGAVSVVLIYLISRRLFGDPAGIIAGSLSVLYWPITYFDGEFLIPVLIVFLDLILILILLRALSSRSVVPWSLAGAVLGLSALGRPNIMFVATFFAVWIWWAVRARSPGKRPYLEALIFVLAIVVTILPVTIRNSAAGGDRVLIAWQGGVNFYIGNNPEANGVTAIGPGMRADWWGGYQDTRLIAESDLGRSLKPSEISNYWYRKGIDFLREHPGQAAKLYLRKIALFLGNGETSNNRQLYFMRDQSRVLSFLPVNFSFILSFALLGLGLALRPRATLKAESIRRVTQSLPLYFIIPYTVSILLFFVTSRYRIPVGVALIPYAGWAVYRFASAIRGQRWSQLGRYSAVVIPLFVITSLNPFNVGGMAESRGLYALGVDYADVDPDKAIEVLSRSIDLDPTYAPAWKVRGFAYHDIGWIDQAVLDLKKATRLDSTFTAAFLGLGFVLHRSAAYEAAIAPYKKVLEIDSTHTAAMINLADIYLRSRRHDQAGELLKRALALDPQSEPALFGLAQYHEKIGDHDRAVELYRKLAHYPFARLKLVIVYLITGRIDQAEAAIHDFEVLFGPSEEFDGLRRLAKHYTKPNPADDRE